MKRAAALVKGGEGGGVAQGVGQRHKEAGDGEKDQSEWLL